MHQVPQIFDQSLRRARKARTAGQAHKASFLLQEVVSEVADRLQAVNRHFPVFVCHGAGELSQHVASHAIATNVVANLTPTGGIVFEESEYPFAEASVDAHASLLTLHAINDLPGALAQIRRALRPDGFFIGALFGSRTLQELRHALTAAEAEVLGGVSPRVAPFLDIRDAGALLQRAGFALPVADTDEITVHYENPLRLLEDLRLMGETNVLQERQRRFLRRDVLMRALEIYKRENADGEGRIRATFEIMYLAGWAPHESQQKPLKPGSAKMKLADAIKATSVKP